MDKVIIDGIDVSRCGAYKDKHCKDKTSIIFCDINLCSNYPNCYYKQLKRLQAENEELKKHQCSFENCDNFERYSTQIHELTKENEELKAKYKQCANENLDEIYELIKKNDCWRGIVNVVNEKLEKENERLKEELRTEKIYSSQIEELEESQQHAKAENEKLKEVTNTSIIEQEKLVAQVNKYSQCLKEIKEQCNWVIDCGVTNDNMNGYYEIKAKINEVIGAE